MLRKSLTCISLLFIGCGLSYFSLDYEQGVKDSEKNELLVGKYFERVVDANGYIAILEIPKIKFKRGLYDVHNPESKLSKNIIFLDKSDMPNMDNSRVIIVGHSGAPSNAYFKYLYKLKRKDKIYLYYNNIKYVYQVTDIYDIIKSGTLALEANQNKKTLTLVTCKGNTKQLVVVATLTKEESN